MSSALIDPAPAYDQYGKIIFMVRSGGYVMVKRPRCVPFVMTEKAWRKLPKIEMDESGTMAHAMTKEFDAQHRDAAVKQILNASGLAAMTPSEIARAIKEPWCWYDGDWPNEAAIVLVCKRVGALKSGRSRWIADSKWEAV